MLKKFLLLICLLAPSFAFAATWNITATWTKSVGPGLTSEKVMYGGVEKCTVTPPAATTCSWTTTTLGQAVVIRSLNAQGAFSESAAITVSDVPVPATGVLLNVTYVGP